MKVLPKRRRARKSKSLPLFDWADLNNPEPFDPVIALRTKPRNSRVSDSLFNRMAELNGYSGRSSDGGGF